MTSSSAGIADEVYPANVRSQERVSALLAPCSRLRSDMEGERPNRRTLTITSAVLWAAGCALVLVGTLLPYSRDLSRPREYGSEGYDSLKLGPVVGAIGGLLVVGGGAAACVDARSGEAAMPPEPQTADRTLPAWALWALIAAVA